MVDYVVSKIQIKRGLKADLPSLDDGELAFCTDTLEYFIGTTSGNKLVNNLIKSSATNGNISVNSQEIKIYDDSSVNAKLAETVQYFNVKNSKYGAIGDETTDDTNAIQSAVNDANANGGGVVYLPKGVYKITSQIIWYTNISLFGEGAGKSILKGYGSNFSVIYFNTSWGSTTNTYNDCTFKDFEIDGSNMGDGTYRVGEKGIFIQYMVRPKFLNLYIHDTPATGFGADFLQDAYFSGCKAYNCGRTWSIGKIGAAGIGIGTGAWPVENITIVGCDTDKSGNFGIFVERQGTGYVSKGTRIIACTATNGLNSGICDKGVDEIKVIGCTMEGNALYGYQTLDTPTGGLVEGCTIRNNTQDGVNIDSATKAPYAIKNSKIYGNGKNGVWMNGVSNVTIQNNEIFSNKNCGIDVSGTLSDLKIDGNDIYNNGQAGIAGYKSAIILEGNITRPRINNNKCYDNQTIKTQSYGIQLSSSYTFTNGTMSDNDLSSNNNGGINLAGTATGTEINRNIGYDPGGSSSITPTSSPWTYTAGSSDCTLYLMGTGLQINIGAQPVFSNVSQATIPLKANQSVTITYTTLTTAYFNRL